MTLLSFLLCIDEWRLVWSHCCGRCSTILFIADDCCFYYYYYYYYDDDDDDDDDDDTPSCATICTINQDRQDDTPHGCLIAGKMVHGSKRQVKMWDSYLLFLHPEMTQNSSLLVLPSSLSSTSLSQSLSLPLLIPIQLIRTPHVARRLKTTKNNAKQRAFWT
jgi:hypothetical protein